MKVVLSLSPHPPLPFSSHFVLTSPEAVLLFQQGEEFCTKCLTKVKTDTSDGLDDVGRLMPKYEFNRKIFQLVTFTFLYLDVSVTRIIHAICFIRDKWNFN